MSTASVPLSFDQANMLKPMVDAAANNATETMLVAKLVGTHWDIVSLQGDDAATVGIIIEANANESGS